MNFSALGRSSTRNGFHYCTFDPALNHSIDQTCCGIVVTVLCPGSRRIFAPSWTPSWRTRRRSRWSCQSTCWSCSCRGCHTSSSRLPGTQGKIYSSCLLLNVPKLYWVCVGNYIDSVCETTVCILIPYVNICWFCMQKHFIKSVHETIFNVSLILYWLRA